MDYITDKPPPYSLFLIQDKNAALIDESQNPPPYKNDKASSQPSDSQTNDHHNSEARIANNEVEENVFPILPASF